uniref:MYND-type domain-containing protein n=1 Tax=Tetradesmus obliquus TaxID=3088 RepID=A0A383WPD8_TETOB|eukprot:jgi/Sobl393_1/5272/SZX79072.1
MCWVVRHLAGLAAVARSPASSSSSSSSRRNTYLFDGDSELLLAVAKQQPPATCQALELAVRGARPTHHHTTVPLAHLSCEVCLHALEWTGQQALPVAQLLSLQFSCIKRVQAGAVAASACQGCRPRNTAVCADLARAALDVMALAGRVFVGSHAQAGQTAAAAAGSAAGSSSTSSPAVIKNCAALMLLARTAIAAGEALASLALCDAAAQVAAVQLDADADAAAAMQPADERMLGELAPGLVGCIGYAALLQANLPDCSLPGEPALRGSMQQRLLQDVQQLQQEAADALATLVQSGNAADSAAPTSSGSGSGSSSSSSGSSSPNLVNSMPAAFVALLPALGARLVACGEGLAALCPVPLCCNNPCCEELRGLSEQQLVAGKGCVCSRCRSARYCSKACQVAHHPAHKKICKSIAASTAT